MSDDLFGELDDVSDDQDVAGTEVAGLALLASLVDEDEFSDELDPALDDPLFGLLL